LLLCISHEINLKKISSTFEIIIEVFGCSLFLTYDELPWPSFVSVLIKPIYIWKEQLTSVPINLSVYPVSREKEASCTNIYNDAAQLSRTEKGKQRKMSPARIWRMFGDSKGLEI
jgi:hypothetical protein